MPKFYTRYGKRIAVQLEFNFPSLTEQHHKDDCDINVVLRRYMKTGVLPEAARGGVYGDFTASASDFREAMNVITEARERFEALPSEVRERFSNSPEKLLAFLDDPENRTEAIKLGLVKATYSEDDAPVARAGDSSACVSGASASEFGASETGADGQSGAPKEN